MVKKLFKQFKYGQKGFTLVELLVVVAILGVLAAVAIPNVGKFIGQGKSEAQAAELHNVQTAAMAAMADAKVGTVSGGGVSANFGNVGGTATECAVDATHNVGSYITGGVAKVHGSYIITATGDVSTAAYP
jgi:type IV pilus assembly protein PilA